MSTSSDTASTVFSTTNLGNELIRGFRNLWEANELFDCTIIIQGETFFLHKGLLIALSPYFQSMFVGGFQESDQNSVELKGITAIGFREVTKYMYTSRITISEENLQEIMEAAAHLQIPNVVDFCAEFIRSQLTVHNWMEFLTLANLYDVTECQQVILNFVAAHSQELSEDEDLWKLPVATFIEILSSDELPFKTETEVVEFALRWLKCHPNVGNRGAINVLSQIRYALISSEDLNVLMDKIPQSLAHDIDLVGIISQARAYEDNLVNMPNLKPKADFRKAQVNCDRILMMTAVSRDSPPENLNSVTLWKVQNDGKIKVDEVLGTFPDRVQDPGLATLGNYVFVVGGQLIDGMIEQKKSAAAYRFDFLTKQWVRVADMLEARSNFGISSLGDSQLLVVAGSCGPHPDAFMEQLRSTELYSMKDNTWRQAADFPYSVVSLTACTIKGQVYACGGALRFAECSFRLHRYDAEKNQWEERSPMYNKKQWHSMAAAGDKIYVFGGASPSHAGIGGPFRFGNHPEQYDPDTNQWTMLFAPRHVQAVFDRPVQGSFVLNNDMYILGTHKYVIFHLDWKSWATQEESDITISKHPVVVKIPPKQV